MELYSETLTCSIAQNDIEAEIRNFFYRTIEIPETGLIQFRDALGYKGREFSDFVSAILNGTLKGKTEKEELTAEFRKIQKNARIKRKNFAGHIEKKTYLLPSKESSPLYKKNLINISDIEAARNEIIVALTEWAESEQNYIDCPYFTYASLSMMKKGYISDILKSLWEKLKNSFNGSFDNYYVSIHKDFIDKPFFSPCSILPELSEFALEDGELKKGVLIRDEKGDVISQLVYDGDPSVRVPVFSNDAKLMLMSFSKYIPDASQFLLDRTIIVSRKELAKLFKTNLTPYTYQRVDKVIDELLFWTYYEKKYAFHLVESRELTDDDIYKIVFTGVGAKEIVERTMIELRREDYNALENRLAKILCHFIRYRQLSLYPYQTEYIEITYHDFLRNAHFPSEDMEINMKFIEDALKDFVTHNLFVYDYKIKGTSFFIKFIEPADYDMDRFRLLFPA